MAERLLVATLYRGKKKEQVWARHYIRVETAIPTLTLHLMRIGQPGDVMEVAHKITGLQIGTIKLHVNNKMTTDWVWDRDEEGVK